MDDSINYNPTARIGSLLKSYRESVRLTQSYVAKKSKISSSMLSQIESSYVSPSVSTLFSICKAMEMDMGHLMTALTQKNPVHIYHPNERPKQEDANTIFETLVPRLETPNFERLFLMEIKSGQEVGLKGSSNDEIAMGYVISGSAILIIDEKTKYPVKKGDSILLNPMISHSFRNSGKTVFRAVWCQSPIRYTFPA